jgi:hypothetical protein
LRASFRFFNGFPVGNWYSKPLKAVVIRYYGNGGNCEAFLEDGIDKVVKGIDEVGTHK